MYLNIFRLRPITRNALRVVNQAIDRGGLFTLRTGFRAIPVVFHLPEHLKLNRLMNTPGLQALVREQPRLGYKYLGNYLAHGLSRQARLRILFNHYEYLTRQVRSDFFTRLIGGIPLWQDCLGEDVVSIRLSFPSGIDFEGDLALAFELNGTAVYNISFVVAPGPHVRSSQAQVLFVSRIQGTKNFESIRHCTKSCHDITPAALLVSALQGIAAALGIGMLVGISNAERLYEGVTFDYDSFWTSFNAGKTAENLFFLPLPLVKTPIELIKGKRRERTLRKRQYKDQICGAVQAYFEEHVLSPRPALSYVSYAKPELWPNAVLRTA